MTGSATTPTTGDVYRPGVAVNKNFQFRPPKSGKNVTFACRKMQATDLGFYDGKERFSSCVLDVCPSAVAGAAVGFRAVERQRADEWSIPSSAGGRRIPGDTSGACDPEVYAFGRIVRNLECPSDLQGNQLFLGKHALRFYGKQ